MQGWWEKFLVLQLTKFELKDIGKDVVMMYTRRQAEIWWSISDNKGLGLKPWGRVLDQAGKSQKDHDTYVQPGSSKQDVKELDSQEARCRTWEMDDLKSTK